MSLLVRASEWKYELRRKVHRLIDQKSQRYLEAPREDVEENMSDSDHEAEYVPRAPEPVVIGFDPQRQGSVYQSYIQDQMRQSCPGKFVNWSKENQLFFDRQSQEIVENRVHRRAMMHQQELFRNQDFMYQEQILHERDYERGHAYTVRPRPENWLIRCVCLIRLLMNCHIMRRVHRLFGCHLMPNLGKDKAAMRIYTA
ncbi:hypothetical protein L1987_29570 [Smallanthus sonchifolius]|uniref:Uncharacterized protein n=1 Tax=Smallanthus sonchifolius TaxID=185202 RepID=A0ACB9I0D2_9ASTR|nr:hypothetical protein L1987_29570 [Smallanthus sonchifolius]